MNFSESDIWNSSLFLRYPIDKIIKLGKLYFYDDGEKIICQNFFEPNVGEVEIKEIENQINENKKVRFSYINDSEYLNNIKKMTNNNNYYLDIIDSWEAPRLFIESNLSDYLINECGSQVKRNYKKYNSLKGKYRFYNSKDCDALRLWNYVLTIDFNSWKKDEKSDMKSLNREDLQYLPFLLLEKELSNLLVVCDQNDNPLAYSLMFKGNNDCWYAVKWGASNEGRNLSAGFFALFNHLEYIYSLNNRLNIDFWGRRNNTYDSLKNNSIIRNHIVIYKKED